MTAYFQDVAVLARKDLLLELRSRDTVPAMLLFVVGALVVFHFALPDSAGDDAARGLLWIAILFTALLGLARVYAAEREQRLLDGLDPRPLRPERHLAREDGERHRLPRPDGGDRAARLRALLRAGRTARWSRRCCSPTSASRPSERSSRRSRSASRTGELILPLLFIPLAIPIVIGGVGASIADESGPLPLVPDPLRRDLCDHFLGFL